MSAPRGEVAPGHEIAKVRAAHCQAVIDAAVREGVAPGQLRAVLSSAFETALRWGLVPVNPVRATTAPSRPRPKLTVPDARQLRAILKAAVGTPWEVPTLLAATTGARRAEVLGLRWRDVDLDRGRVHIDETLQRIDGELRFVPPKTERARREIPLPGFAVDRLRAHKAEQVRRRLALGAEWADLDLVCERGDGGALEPDSFSKGVDPDQPAARQARSRRRSREGRRGARAPRPSGRVGGVRRGVSGSRRRPLRQRGGRDDVQRRGSVGVDRSPPRGAEDCPRRRGASSARTAPPKHVAVRGQGHPSHRSHTRA